jgi:hypothetical protein
MPDPSPSRNPAKTTPFFSSRQLQDLPSRFFSRLASTNPEVWAVLLIFAVNILLVSPRLMPGFAQINPYDEAKYVESGWLLLKGEVRSLAWGPLVALFYAPTHLLVGNSSDWFMIETWVGRFLLFGFMWLSLVYLASQLREHASPFVTVGLLFVTIPLFPILENQSDAVFVSLSVLGLANLIAFSRSQRLRSLCFASICVGLGALARVETVVLVGTLAVLSFVIGRKRYPARKILGAAILPAAGILVLLFALNLITVGNLNLGISNKSYESFEVNQSILTGGDLEQARQESRRLFGTQEQNNSSVLRAILRNPPAFTARILANAKWTARFYLSVFGKTQSFVLLFFSAWGVYALARKCAFWILIILLAWPLHAVIPLGFLARHVVPQTYYLPIILSGIGMVAAFSRDSLPSERRILMLGLLLLCVYSLVDHKPAFLYGGILVAAVLGITWILRQRWLAGENGRLVPLMLMLAAGLILRDPYPFPNYSGLGSSSEESAVHYMESNLPERSRVLVPFPQPAVAARMVDVTTQTVPGSVNGAGDLWSWLTARGIQAAYIDHRYQIDEQVSAWLESGLGQYFASGFTSADQSVHVYLVRNP